MQSTKKTVHINYESQKDEFAAFLAPEYAHGPILCTYGHMTRRNIASRQESILLQFRSLSVFYYFSSLKSRIRNYLAAIRAFSVVLRKNMSSHLRHSFHCWPTMDIEQRGVLSKLLVSPKAIWKLTNEDLNR